MIRKYFFCCFFSLVHISSIAQSKLIAIDPKNSRGIHFEEGLSWNQVLGKAKEENRIIFIDCYTTWCGPCKSMDKNVYPDEAVGNLYNGNFVCVRVQMDSSIGDDELTKNWYSDANYLMSQYKVNAFPTYLFISPDGKLVHKAVGARSISMFISVGKDAMNPERQYYTLLENYQKGHKDYTTTPYLANTAKDLKDGEVAKGLAQDYLRNYLDRLPKEEFLKKENLEFIIRFASVINSKDRSFNLIFQEGQWVDSVMDRRGISKAIVDLVITREEIDMKLWVKGNPETSATNRPNWGELINTIKCKYGEENAERVILNSQLKWYGYKHDWPQIVKLNAKKIDKYGLDTAGLGKVFLNNMIWDVFFKHTDNKKYLGKAIGWMEIILKNTNPNFPSNVDTYANLLYKVGEWQKAMLWEKKAVALEDADAYHGNRVADSTYAQTLKKMEGRIPTW